MRARSSLRLLPLALLAGCFGTCGACSDSTKSTNVRTSGVRAEMRVTVDDHANADVRVQLRVGGAFSNTFLELVGGDALTADAGGRSISLTPVKGVIEPPAFVGQFRGVISGVVSVKLARPGDTSALGSAVTLPPALAILTPKPSEAVSPRAPVVVTWKPEPAAGPIAWTTRGGCIDESSGTLIDDVGRLELPLPPSKAYDAGSAPSCEVLITLERTSTGTLDPAFGEGGAIVAVQQRTRTVRWSR